MSSPDQNFSAAIIAEARLRTIRNLRAQLRGALKRAERAESELGAARARTKRQLKMLDELRGVRDALELGARVMGVRPREEDL